MGQNMRPTRYIVAGWSLGLALFAGGAIALPAIADQSVNTRDDVVWTNKAEAFVRDETGDLDTRAHVSLAKLGRHFVKTPDNPYRRDRLRTQKLSQTQFSLVKTAEADMAEQLCLSQAVYFEARSETRSGQLAVAEVVQNRVASKHYPNSICGVVFQGSERRTGCQFSFTCDGSMKRVPKGKAWDRAQSIAMLSRTGLLPKTTGRATHYHTTEVNPKWTAELQFTQQIGDHKFYHTRWRERPVKSSGRIAVAPPAP